MITNCFFCCFTYCYLLPYFVKSSCFIIVTIFVFISHFHNYFCYGFYVHKIIAFVRYLDTAITHRQSSWSTQPSNHLVIHSRQSNGTRMAQVPIRSVWGTRIPGGSTVPTCLLWCHCQHNTGHRMYWPWQTTRTVVDQVNLYYCYTRTIVDRWKCSCVKHKDSWITVYTHFSSVLETSATQYHPKWPTLIPVADIALMPRPVTPPWCLWHTLRAWVMVHEEGIMLDWNKNCDIQNPS